jgi:hypothetical protein
MLSIGRPPRFIVTVNAYLAGDTGTGKAILRELVNATVGFEGPAAEINKPQEPAPHARPARQSKHREFCRDRERAAKEDVRSEVLRPWDCDGDRPSRRWIVSWTTTTPIQ